MRPSILLVLAYASSGLLGCRPAAAAPGTPQAFGFACAHSNEGRRIAVEGYLRLPPLLDSKKSVVLRLYPDPSFKGTPIGVPLLFGDTANEAHKITSAYHDDDLKVYLEDGRAVPFGTRVRVSGSMVLPVVPQDYECALENPYLEATN